MEEKIMAKEILNRFKESIDEREEELGKHKNKISMINSLYSLMNKDKITDRNNNLIYIFFLISI